MSDPIQNPQSKIQNPAAIPPALDFPGRSTLTPPEIAARIGATTFHVRNLIEAGVLEAINISTDPDGRPNYRVLIASYHKFIQERYTH